VSVAVAVAVAVAGGSGSGRGESEEGRRDPSSVSGFVQMPMWRVERKGDSSGNGNCGPEPEPEPEPGTCTSGPSATPSSLRWVPLELDVRGGEVGWDRLHGALTDVLYSFEARGEGMLIRVANWSVPWRG
jgi:hypothetical protein